MNSPNPTNSTTDRMPVRGDWSRTVALVALGVAVAVAVFVWVEQQSGIGLRVSELRQDAGARDSQYAALAARVDEVVSARRRLEDDLDRLRERMSRETESVAELPARMDEIEKSVQRFVSVGDKVRAAWLLAEAEHYMRIANAQLGLAGDVDVATTALGLADDALRGLNDPRMTPVRKILATEIAALRTVPRPDTEGIVLSLGGLADSLETLPLKSAAPVSFTPQPTALRPDAPWSERLYQRSLDALGAFISVRRTDTPVTPLLSEAEESLLLRSLDLELQLARLAAMRGDAGMFRRSIESATQRLEQQFDLAAPEVQAALATLSDLDSQQLPEEIPDISGSLAALLELTGQGAPVEKPAANVGRGKSAP